MLLLADRFHVASPPDKIVALLFYCIPPVALVFCGAITWLSKMTVARKIGWMLFALLAMSLQVGILLAMIIVATAYVPSR
jgi:hypothetical protein